MFKAIIVVILVSGPIKSYVLSKDFPDKQTCESGVQEKIKFIEKYTREASIAVESVEGHCEQVPNK